MAGFIPLSVPNLKGNEQKYVADAISNEWVSYSGSYVGEFEERFAAYAKTDKAAACQSGTAALHLALVSCGIGPGSIVVAPALTFVATANPVSYVGASPVFMDCDDSLCMDMEKLEAYFSEECVFKGGSLVDKSLGLPVKAVLVTHVFGNCADMEGLVHIAGKYGVAVIEDAAEAVGSFYVSGKYAGKMLGTIGDVGAYSFNGNKIITTGGGGMLVSGDKGKLARMKHLSTQAKTDEVYFVHDEVGYNYRMTNLQAALGVAQLEQLEAFVAAKKENYFYYAELGIPLLPFSGKIRPNYWFYSYESDDRDGLVKRLAAAGIQSRPIWKLMNLLPMYRNCRAYRIEKAHAYYGKVVNVPCSSNLSKTDVERVAKEILRNL
jgi:perosamine synthetase